MDPATRLVMIDVVEPDMHEPSGDLERVADALRSQWDIAPITASLPVLKIGRAHV